MFDLGVFQMRKTAGWILAADALNSVRMDLLLMSGDIRIDCPMAYKPGRAVPASSGPRFEAQVLENNRFANESRKNSWITVLTVRKALLVRN